MRDENINVKIYNLNKKEIHIKKIDQLIKEMIASQIPINFDIEALKAQAIMAMTLLVRKMKIFGGVGCKEYERADICKGEKWMDEDELKKKWGDDFERNWKKVDRAFKETEGKIITINNKPIDPRYHLTCGGATENSENVDGSKILYLRRMLCDYCKNSPYYSNYVELSLEEIEKRLDIKTEKASPTKGPNIEGIIEEIIRDEQGRIRSMKIGGKKLKGAEVMKLLGLNSTRFGWKPIAFRIETKGEGHGLGLCQYGANEMAKEGKTAEEILKYYFTGVEIKTVEKPSVDSPMKGKVIVLDAGHGGDNTEDVVGVNGTREKDINLSITLKLADFLRKAGAKVYLTRETDVYVPLSQRADISNNIKPNFFLSIHQNSFGNPNISGSEIYYYRGDKEGEILANHILEQFSSMIGITSKGVKVAGFYLLREVRSSTLQVEVGFITNPEEEKKLKNEKYQTLVAREICNAFIKYYSYE
ncbi:stage II sporulation protein D [Lutibacter sp. B2]|nr:stage II sporulation protein D [Lutibacter sp. B2]